MKAEISRCSGSQILPFKLKSRDNTEEIKKMKLVDLTKCDTTSVMTEHNTSKGAKSRYFELF